MTTDTGTLFLALLAVMAEVAVVAALILAVAGRWSTVVDLIGPQSLALALLIAAVSMIGSLWFSEGAHFIPCKLCWYQRICMYPLVPILGLAVFRRENFIRPYAGLLAGIGIVISGYHILIERYPSLESGTCDPANPCSLKWVERFGYLTIPTMAASAFALILVLLAAQPREA